MSDPVDLSAALAEGELLWRVAGQLAGLSPAELAALAEFASVYATQAALDALALDSGNLPAVGDEDDVLTVVSGVAAWAPPTGGPGVSDWGDIAGTLADQTDLQAELDAKQAASAILDEYAAVNPTTWGLGLVPLADAAAARTYLGLGTAATSGTAAFDAAGLAAAVEGRGLAVGIWNGSDYKQADGTDMPTDPDRVYLYCGVGTPPSPPPNVDASFWWPS